MEGIVLRNSEIKYTLRVINLRAGIGVCRNPTLPASQKRVRYRVVTGAFMNGVEAIRISFEREADSPVCWKQSSGTIASR